MSAPWYTYVIFIVGVLITFLAKFIVAPFGADSDSAQCLYVKLTGAVITMLGMLLIFEIIK